MKELIAVIQAAVADGATHEQKAAGVLACRTIATALDTEPGKPFALPGVTPTALTSRVSIDQVLDLAIARLSQIAKESESKPPPTPNNSTAPRSPPVPARGLQIPLAASPALRAAPRAAAPRVQAKPRPAAKPVIASVRKS